MGAAEYALLLVTRPFELRSLVQFKVWHEQKRDITAIHEHATSGWDRQSMRDSWAFLDLTSRSFAAVIKELDGDLARIVCLFYLVLRGLDTIEDDMSLPNDIKLPLLRCFHEKLYQPGWNFDGNGDKEKDKPLLVGFQCVIEEFGRLDENAQNIIADIARKMGAGMADFAALSTPSQPVAEVQTLEHFSLYCHYVAGLVGEGLSRLFSSTGKERPWLKDQLVLSNSMALLLQKTNILRDIKEDVDDGRAFWPREVYADEKYGGGFKSVKELVLPENRERAMWVLSTMTVDAIGHATDALDYLSLLKNQSVFNFCAIPAVMAMATLELCFMNPAVFERNVKIRKGQAVQLIMACTNPRDVAFLFRDYARKIHAKAKPSDPSFVKISIACGRIEQWTEHQYPSFILVNRAAASNGSSGGPPPSTLDPTLGDARIRIAASKATKDAEKSLRRRIRERSEWRVSQGLPALREGEADPVAGGGEISFWMLGASLIALVLLMVVMAGGIAWVVFKFSD